MPFRRPRTVEDVRKSRGKFSEGRIGSLLLMLGALVLGPLLLVLFYRHSFGGLVHPDAMDYAQVGRHLAEGQGFTTGILRPLSLTHGSDPLRQPDVTHGPLYQFFLAVAIATFGSSDRIIVGVSGLFFLLTGLLIYRLGLRIFDRSVGIIAALVFLCNVGNLRTALTGLPLPLYAFLMTAILLVLYEIASRCSDEASTEETAPRGLLILAGVLSGALYLADPIFVFVLPVIIAAVAIVCRTKRLASLAAFGLSLFVVALPWMCRNAALTGNPFLGQKGMEVWMQTRVYPGYSAYRLTTDAVEMDMALFRSVLQKLMGNIVGIVPALVGSIAGPLLVFLIPSFLFRFRNVAANRVRTVMLSITLALLLGQVLIGVDTSLFAAMAPVFYVFAAGFLIHLGKQAQLKRSAVLALSALFVFVLACPILSELIRPASTSPLPHSLIARSLKQRSKPGDLCLSDQPWLVAWYAERPALLIPSQASKTETLGQKMGGIKWLFLTRDARAMSPEWEQVYILFARWDVAYRGSLAAKKTAPNLFQMNGNLPPILKGLSGLCPTPPLAEAVSAAKDGNPIDPPVAIIASTAAGRGQAAKR